MSIPADASRITPEHRTTAFYLTLFMAPGAAVMFLPIWLSEKGITTEQIGLINALPVLAILTLNMIIGRIADRAKDWRQVIVIGALIAGIAPIGLFFVNEFWGILLLWTLITLPQGAIIPVLDAATMRLTKRNGTDYGSIRAWGTLGYMLFNALTGFLIAWFGSVIFVPLFVGLALLRALVALQLPNFRAPGQKPTLATAAKQDNARIGILLRQPWFVLPLLGFSLVYGSHFVLNGFSALLWKQQGISETIIGPLFALASLSETLIMFAWKRFGKKISARHIILLSASVTVIRFFIMGFSPPVVGLVLLQSLHGLTYAIGFLGCVNFISNWTSEDIAAEVQSLFMVAQQVAAMVALLCYGWLVGQVGNYVYFFAALGAGVGAIFVVLSLKLVQPKG
jgi:PPP family 3-phenylpropionic acid transporter